MDSLDATDFRQTQGDQAISLIAVPVHDRPDNNRSWMTRATLESLAKTVDWSKHRLFVCNDASTCEKTLRLFEEAKSWLPFTLISLETNVGTARATNKAWVQRNPGEHCIKCDNDVTFGISGWLDQLEDCVARNPKIGLLALKRRDLGQWTDLPWGDNLKTRLLPLSHERGQRWLAVEVSEEMIGTCCLHSSDCLDRIGYLYQPTRYAWEDCLMAVRAQAAGFLTGFLPWIDIDHVDPGGTEYTTWKQEEAGRTQEEFVRIKKDYISGARPIYQGADD